MLLFAVLVVCFSFYASALSALVERDGPSPNPSATNFLRRAFHASVILGDYLYIDGGDFSQLVDGVQYILPNNYTLSIDLASSWTNTSVTMSVVPKGSAPKLNQQALWRTPDGQSCYMWGGEVSGLSQDPPPPTDLWKFTSNSSGGGVWAQIPVNSETFSSLVRASVGSGVSISDTGLYVGGVISGKTTHESGTGTDATGVISFNYTSGIWELDSSLGLGTNGEIVGARAVTIPAFGLDGRGLMVVLGGSDPARDPSLNWGATPGNNTMMLLSNITMYDPYIGLWTAQRATGDIPPPREMFCAVSVAGDNGTYEIFVHGGFSSDTWIVYDDVYVLTIPGFVWFKAPYVSTSPRYEHTCELVRGRQLIIIGGLDNREGVGLDISGAWLSPDQLSQGIGVFDVTSMEWKSSYDADLTTYQTPDVVKEWYSAGNLDSVQWQSKEIARMFIRDKPVSVSPTPAAVPTSTAASTPNKGGFSQSDKITLGVGLGIGLPTLILPSFLTWWFKFRKGSKLKKKKNSLVDVEHRETSQSVSEDHHGVLQKPTEVSSSETGLSQGVKSVIVESNPVVLDKVIKNSFVDTSNEGELK